MVRPVAAHSRTLLAGAALVAAAATTVVRPAAAQIAPQEYADRRAALAADLPDGVTLALGAPEPEENYLSFNQSARFLYLTGIREPGAALVIVKRGRHVAPTLFVQPSDPSKEVWTGHRIGVAGAARLTGLPVRPSGDLQKVLDSLLATGASLHVVANVSEEGSPPAAEQDLVRGFAERHRRVGVDANPTAIVDRLRGQKSAAELDLIRRAVAITVDAQREAIAAVKPGMNEFELQALIEYTFRRNGADRPSFSTIVGSGPNATTLHYNADDRFMQPGDMVVMDVGASYRGYAADVTRSVPVSGKFTADQRAIYQLVRDAQRAAESRVAIGSTKQELADTAAATIAAGLARLGLIESPTATYDCAEEGQHSCPQYRLYYMHGLGHGIGLDVHDPDQYDDERIAVGSAFTIEPGVYVRANLLEILPDTRRNRALAAKIGPAVARYANIGVRIEDDYIATAHGVDWVSRAPREADEIEAAIAARASDPLTRRDSTKVEWYRKTEGLGP